MQEHLGEWPGPIIEEESNKVVAMHKGFWFYTIGQRSGLDLGHLPNGPWCVTFDTCRHFSAFYFSSNHIGKSTRAGLESCTGAIPFTSLTGNIFLMLVERHSVHARASSLIVL
jgi:hypothetical protein